ncbi:Fimbrillin-like [Xylanibacter ruminicola]|uniref:Fimbrillin-like n=1 Tax=Xylanibacter ruminicola TaxID=839 RepID=A0A1H3ZUD4_XYLRU|nr:hypothetical protein [Xylanibacter ruminicola]SEA27333.1 Fimbrillin-like [Xylanibacter ruminicola]
MKKQVLFAIATMTLASCSSDGLVNNSSSGGGEAPIAFSVEKKNITRATNLETLGHYNFGVWAYKYKEGAKTGAEVMNHYLVGYSNGVDEGYDKSKATTWAGSTDSDEDHVSPWFYEGLGNGEYSTTNSKFYQSGQTAYMAKNSKQILRYWDLAYATTNFYAYAPYNQNVTFEESSTGAKTMTFGATNTIRDGYDNPLNSAYTGFDRSLSEYMYAGVQATNSAKKDVIVPFKHMGAQVNVRFYEDIPNYRVEIIDLGADNGTFATDVKDDLKKGIQATPAKKTEDTYGSSKYFTTNGATITFDADATPTFKYTTEGSNETSDNLMFLVPNTNLDETTIPGHKLIPEAVTSGTQTAFATSPTVYYAVAQPDNSETGFTFHISYRIIAEDNKEVITVHNATVFVPAKDGSEFIAAWQPNVKYTYSFKITKNSTGTTYPETEIKPTDPTPSTKKSLYPIVFDGATIEDYTPNSNAKEY